MSSHYLDSYRGALTLLQRIVRGNLADCYESYDYDDVDKLHRLYLGDGRFITYSKRSNVWLYSYPHVWDDERTVRRELCEDEVINHLHSFANEQRLNGLHAAHSMMGG